MSANAELVARWEQVQQKTFTNWVNMHLSKRGRNITDLTTDFKDGVNLLYLLSAISDEPVPKHVAVPKMKVQSIENINTALRFIDEHGVKLAGTGATEIYDGNVKMTLGMVWCLILRFVVSGLSEEGLSAKEGLLLWCQRKTKGYNHVNVQDFSGSFQDGLAFCALIHRHRPDLLDFDKLTPEDKAGNLDLAFQVAADHLDIPRLLDVEDIVSMPRPDERSIMTYVAQLYKVFSSLDQAESAGRRVSKFVDDLKEVSDLVHDYEERTRALVAAVLAKAEELSAAELASEYQGAKALIAAFRDYRKSTKRQWASEQSDLAALFTQIQAKLSSMNRPAYVPPQGLLPRDVEGDFETLNAAERSRRTALNASLREILNALRRAFADPANSFFEQVVQHRAVLNDLQGSLDEQLATLQSHSAQLDAMADQLPTIEAAEQACDACNIEENEFTDHTYDDVQFEFEQGKKAFSKAIAALEAQIAASKASTGVTAEQLEEFKKTFQHFDVDNDGTLSRLEFKSVLSGLGLIALDFEGQDKKTDEIFAKVSGGADVISFDQYVSYMVSINSDATSVDQLTDSFTTIAGGRPFVTAADLKVAGMSAEQVEFLTKNMPPGPHEGSYDYKAWLASQTSKRRFSISAPQENSNVTQSIKNIPTLEQAIRDPRYGYPDPSSFPQKVETPYFRFELVYQSRRSAARVGRIHTPHGIIDTPGFVPVATNAALKYVDIGTTAKNQLGTQLIFANTYHMLIHPGPDIVAEAGGVHKFCKYDKPMITDSGGFQVFSMANVAPQDELKGKVVRSARNPDSNKVPNLLKKISETGVQFRSYRDGRLIELTPQSSVQAQKKFGADIIIPLDILLPNSVTPKKLLESYHRTHRWEAQSLMEHLKDLKGQAMYAVIHGATNMRLRKLSLEYLSKLPFQGLAIGGSLGKNSEEMNAFLEEFCPLLPRHLPVHLLGIGDPPSIRSGVLKGIDTFDSAYPTKTGRHGNLFTKDGSVNLRKAVWENVHNKPPVEGCDCPTCSTHSAAYLHHLFKMEEPIALSMGATHNIHFMMNMMKEIRKDILDGKL